LLKSEAVPCFAPLQQWPATITPDLSPYGQLGEVS
jgi:hypothetical protein